MREKSKLLKALAAFTALALCTGALGGCANLQQPRQWDGCAIGGAIVGGAAGFGIGLGIANAVGRSGDNVFNEERLSAAWISALGGAALGTLAGHYLCDPVIQAAATHLGRYELTD